MTSSKWLLMLAVALAFPGQARDFSLGPPERLLLQRTFATNVTIGDFNGDGRDDLAATMAAMPRWELHLFLQRGDGSLAPSILFDLPFAYDTDTGYAVSRVDVEGDGIDEIVVGSDNRGMAIVRYDGTRMLSMRQVQGSHGCRYVAVADIDSDGHVDIACHDWQLTATFHYGDGAGGFVARTLRTSFGTFASLYYFKGIRLADVTGDGRPDLLGTDSLITSFFVHENAGGRTFLPARAYPHPPSAARTWSPSVAIMDLGGDGVPEVVTASPENGEAAMFNVHHRQPSGFLRRTGRFPTYDSVTAIQVADVDADGMDDLVAAHYGFNAVTVTYQRDGTLSHSDRFDLPGFIGQSQSVALGDLDGDGCLDLAAGSVSGLFLLRGCREGRLTLPRYDRDGDGVSDIIVAIQDNLAVAEIWPWAEVMYFVPESNYLRLPYVPGRLEVQAWGDFDGDGASDLFVRDLDSGVNRAYLMAQRVTALAPQPDLAWRVQGSGDFDGDDRSDLFWRNTATGDNEIWPAGDAGGRYAVDRVPDTGWNVAAIGDFDGNGSSDLFWRHANGGNVVWYDGRKQQQKPLPSINPHWLVAGVGDLDGDNADDVVWRSPSLGRNAVWRGADAASQITVEPRQGEEWSIRVVGDFDGDGQDDLFWHDGTAGTAEIWLSGDATRRRAVADILPPRWVVR